MIIKKAHNFFPLFFWFYFCSFTDKQDVYSKRSDVERMKKREDKIRGANCEKKRRRKTISVSSVNYIFYDERKKSNLFSSHFYLICLIIFYVFFLLRLAVSRRKEYPNLTQSKAKSCWLRFICIPKLLDTLKENYKPWFIQPQFALLWHIVVVHRTLHSNIFSIYYLFVFIYIFKVQVRRWFQLLLIYENIFLLRCQNDNNGYSINMSSKQHCYY